MADCRRKQTKRGGREREFSILIVEFSCFFKPVLSFAFWIRLMAENRTVMGRAFKTGRMLVNRNARDDVFLGRNFSCTYPRQWSRRFVGFEPGEERAKESRHDGPVKKPTDPVWFMAWAVKHIKYGIALTWAWYGKFVFDFFSPERSLLKKKKYKFPRWRATIFNLNFPFPSGNFQIVDVPVQVSGTFRQRHL